MGDNYIERIDAVVMKEGDGEFGKVVAHGLVDTTSIDGIDSTTDKKYMVVTNDNVTRKTTIDLKVGVFNEESTTDGLALVSAVSDKIDEEMKKLNEEIDEQLCWEYEN